MFLTSESLSVTLVMHHIKIEKGTVDFHCSCRVPLSVFLILSHMQANLSYDKHLLFDQRAERLKMRTYRATMEREIGE